MNAVMDWWKQNTPRDQLAMFILGVAFCLFILYAIVSGSHGQYTQQIENNKRVTASLNQVREMSSELLARSSSTTTAGSSNMTERVNSSLGEFNLKLSSMQPQANGAVRLRMEQMPYTSIIAWLHEMEVNQGIKIKDSSITTGSNKGTVSITVTLIQ